MSSVSSDRWSEMSIHDLSLDGVANVEGNRYCVPVEPESIDSGGSDDAKHIPPEESPDEGPALADLVGEKPITDDGKSALKYGASRFERKRRIVAELLACGLDSLARRVASCGNNGFHCDRPHLCRLCHRRKRFDAKQRHADWLKEWKGHVLLALTMPLTREHPSVARKDVLDRYRTVRRRASFKNTVTQAFGGVHTVRDDNGGEFRAHLDLLCEARETSTIRTKLGNMWSDVGGGHVEATTVTTSSDGTYADAVEATTCYVVEKTGLSVSAQIDYALVRPDGANHWVTFMK